ncbi:helix-turn-helix domain-containing protein [Spirillospora sp. NPDC047279]|uniref:GlxA family transcriptional regulator n=1 Tax=Spirillospora sp. NPDC047279 TaxID=3155478 RepID=UPI0033ECA418
MIESPHRVAVLVVPPVVPFDVSIPHLVLGGATHEGQRLYDVRMCAAEAGTIATNTDYGIAVSHGLEELERADTIIIPGTHTREDIDPRVLDAVRRCHEAGRRLVTICTGTFVLAEAGLLDGRRVTTYWKRAEEFAARYPGVELDPSVLFVDDGLILSSAGLAAGIDLCLHILRTDYGSAAANASARRVVVAPVRSGGQAQFITSPSPGREDGASLAETQEWALERLDHRITMDDLARQARMSSRTLSRRFRSETGLSPLQWLLRQRLDRARELLETTALPVDQVAHTSGLGSSDSLRAHFVRHVGLTPSAYRSTFSRREAEPR